MAASKANPPRGAFVWAMPPKACIPHMDGRTRWSSRLPGHRPELQSQTPYPVQHPERQSSGHVGLPLRKLSYPRLTTASAGGGGGGGMKGMPGGGMMGMPGGMAGSGGGHQGRRLPRQRRWRRFRLTVRFAPVMQAGIALFFVKAASEKSAMPAFLCAALFTLSLLCYSSPGFSAPVSVPSGCTRRLPMRRMRAAAGAPHGVSTPTARLRKSIASRSPRREQLAVRSFQAKQQMLQARRNRQGHALSAKRLQCRPQNRRIITHVLADHQAQMPVGHLAIINSGIRPQRFIEVLEQVGSEGNAAAQPRAPNATSSKE